MQRDKEGASGAVDEAMHTHTHTRTHARTHTHTHAGPWIQVGAGDEVRHARYLTADTRARARTRGCMYTDVRERAQDRGFKSVLVTKLGTPEYRAPDIYIDTPGSIVGGTGAILRCEVVHCIMHTLCMV
jgi:hypothetical protein